jgi:hypothetical protein
VTASFGLRSPPAMPADWSEDWFGEECLVRSRKAYTIGEQRRTFVERVRLFEPGGLAALCTAAVFAVDAVPGEYAGCALIADSPRTNLFARRQ